MTKIVKTPNQLLPKGGKVLAQGARHWRQCDVIRLFGTVKFGRGFSYKAERAKC